VLQNFDDRDEGWDHIQDTNEVIAFGFDDFAAQRARRREHVAWPLD
jgi:hypothetical protein